MRDGPPSGSGIPKLALAVLVACAIVSPWPFGSVPPRTTEALAILSLLTSLGVALAARHPLALPRSLTFSLAGLWLLACLQLVPLPGLLLRLVAPGASAVWHPAEPVAAAVLGTGPHPLSLYPEATARWLALVTGLAFLSIWAAPALAARRTALRSAVAIVSGGVLVALYGLVARLVFGDKLYGFLAVPTIAPFGPFVSKNHFAGYVELAACLAVGLAVGLADEARKGPERLSWLDSRRASWVVVAWGASGVLVLAVAVSLSRGGVVSLTLGLVAFAMVRLYTRRSGPTRRTLALLAACLLVVGVGLTGVLPQEARSRVVTLANARPGGPDPFRIGVWHDSLRLAAASPLLGFGLGAYQDALPRFKTGVGDLRVEHAENDYLELLADGGVVALALVVIATLALVALGLRRIRAEPHRLARGLRAGALAGVVVIAVHSAFDFNLRIPSNALLVAALAAFLLAPTSEERDAEADAPPARRAWLRVLLLAAATLLALVTPWTARHFDSERLLRASAAPIPGSGLRWRTLEDELVTHLRHRPADAPAWVALAWLRRPDSAAAAAALARWGTSLDPRHEALRRAAEPMSGAPQGPPPR